MFSVSGPRSVWSPRRPFLPGVASVTSVLVISLLAGCASGRHTTPQSEVTMRAPAAAADPAVDLRIADSALQAGDTQLAVSLYQRMLKADPNSATAHLGLGDAAYASGDIARAGVLFARVHALRPDDPRAQLGLARVALRERRIDEAEARYRTLVAARPDSAVAAEGLGTTLDLQGKHDEAQALYRAALRRHPEALGLKVNLGLSLILSRKAREGANVLLDIAGLPDAPPQARQNLALAYGLLGNEEAAKRILAAENLPADSIEDGLAFYRILRAHLSGQSAGVRNDATVVPVSVAPLAISGMLK